MMAKKMVTILLTVCIVMALFAGCATPAQETQESTANEEASAASSEAASTEESETAEMDNEDIYIHVIGKGYIHQFWQAAKMGVEQAGEDFGVEVYFEAPEGDALVDQQIDQMETAIEKNASAICVAAIDSKALIPSIEKAQSKGILVLTFDSGVDSDIPTCHLATDNLAAAALAADKMAELIGGEGEVAIVVQDEVSTTGKNRRDGFKNQIEAQYPDIKIVDIQYGKGDHLLSTDLAKTIIQAHPNLKGIFGANEGSAVGVINAITEMDMIGKIVAVGYDAGKLQKEAVRSGLMSGAITQDPVGMGYKSVETALKALKGESVPKFIDTGFKWYDSSNMDNDEFKYLLYD